MSTLREQLLDIDGVGPETADKIEAVVDAQNDAAVALVSDALEYFARDNPAYARSRVEDAYEALS